MKCEVIRPVTLTLSVGNVVEVSEKQFEVAKAYLKPVVIVETKEEKPKRTRKPKQVDENVERELA